MEKHARLAHRAGSSETLHHVDDLMSAVWITSQVLIPANGAIKSFILKLYVRTHRAKLFFDCETIVGRRGGAAGCRVGREYPQSVCLSCCKSIRTNYIPDTDKQTDREIDSICSFVCFFDHFVILEFSHVTSSAQTLADGNVRQIYYDK